MVCALIFSYWSVGGVWVLVWFGLVFLQLFHVFMNVIQVWISEYVLKPDVTL